MISPDIYQEEREHFFDSWKRRISGISLLKDKVMPFSGVEACASAFSHLAGSCSPKARRLMLAVCREIAESDRSADEEET